MSASKYAAGRDYGFWLDINGDLKVFGEMWTYNLPQTPTIPVGTHVRLDGTAGTGIVGPDIAALAGAKTLTIELDISLDDWTPTGGQHAVNQWGGGPGLNSWYFLIDPSGLLRMTTPALGDLAQPIYYATVPSPTFTDGSRHVVGGTWAADNGTNSTMQFRIDGASAGSLLTGASVPAGLFNSSHPIRIGGATGGGRMIGNVYGLKIYADGNLVASPDFMTMQSGQTTITDAQGNVWTLAGAANVVAIPGVPGGETYHYNKAVIALEEPLSGGSPAPRPPAGGFMLGEQGQIIPIGYYDPNYWKSFPPDAQAVEPPPVIEIPLTQTGFIDIAASPSMGCWALDAAGQPRLVYISPLSHRYSTIKSGSFQVMLPPGGPYVSIAVSSEWVHLLDANGQVSYFGYGNSSTAGLHPVPVYPDPADGKWIRINANPGFSDGVSFSWGHGHVCVISDQGKVAWWPDFPNVGHYPLPGGSLQTPPADKGYLDIAAGPYCNYLLKSDGQVVGYGEALGVAAGVPAVLTPAGHTGLAQGPPMVWSVPVETNWEVWGFAVVAETLNNPFGVTLFGLDQPIVPPNQYRPNPPPAFRVYNYNSTNDKIYLQWDPSLSGIPAQFFEVTMTPVTGGAAPTVPPAGSRIQVVPNSGFTTQQTEYQLPANFHQPAYYMIRAIGQGGVMAGGASDWISITYDTTLKTGFWRKVVVDIVDQDCDLGGFVVLLDIDDVYVGGDGWTGAQIADHLVPPGVYYSEVGTKVSVARENGLYIGGKQSTQSDVNGLTGLPVPQSPTRFTTAVVDYEISIEQSYRYWAHNASTDTPISEGNANGLTVTPLLESCPGNEQYLRCLLTPDLHTTSGFCLGHLDQLDFEIRSGVFAVLGRPAPVVVVDTRSTAKGHLIFLSHGTEEQARGELHTLREMFRMGHPLMLQTMSDYELADGQLYFQPTSVVDRWVGADARRPEHAIEVDFVEIDPPRGRTIVRNVGIPWTTPLCSVLEKPGDYFDYAGNKNPLFGLTFANGGSYERYHTCNDLQTKPNGSSRTCNDVFYSPDPGVC